MAFIKIVSPRQASGETAEVYDKVEEALPSSSDESEGFHRLPEDAVEAFAFVGTRYAYRTTQAMIDALKGEGYEDLDILDLAIVLADANQWARTYRLVGLEPELYYLQMILSVEIRSFTISAAVSISPYA